MKILVVRFSSIGDIVLTTPVIRVLKTQLNAEVHYLTKSKFRALLDSNPFLDRIWTIDKEIDELVADLKKEGFDEIIDLHNNLRTHLLSRKLGCTVHRFKKYNLRKLWLVWTKKNVLPDVHIVDRYLETCAHLGVVNDDKGLDYFPMEKSLNTRGKLPRPWQDGYFAVVIGGQHPGKVMPPEKWALILSQTDFPVVLLGGPEDKKNGDSIVSKGGAHVFNACGMFSLDESAVLVRDADFVLAHDTGLMHIAAALKKNIISIWGATVPEFGMYPYQPGPNSIMIQPEGYRDLPYSKLGDHKWYKKPFGGWDHLDEARVLDAIRDQIRLLTPSHR